MSQTRKFHSTRKSSPSSKTGWTQKKLRPEVIIAKMMPAKRLTWTESKEGDVLCYDVPAGNFHSCNGDQIKYWKPVDFPSKHNRNNIE